MDLSVKKYLKAAIVGFLKIIFPRNCFICKTSIAEGFLCSEDWRKIHFLQTPACAICFYPFEFELSSKAICPNCLKKKPEYHKALSIMKYDEASKILISKFKYQDQTHISKIIAEMMKKLMLQQWQQEGVIEKIDFIAPVPLHKIKLIKRRYNQSAILGKQLSKITNIPIISDLLIRSVNTKSQSALDKKLRAKNVGHAFILNKKYQTKIFGKNILLIDDVITTGATINSCSKILNKSGAAIIYVMTIAKTV